MNISVVFLMSLILIEACVLSQSGSLFDREDTSIPSISSLFISDVDFASPYFDDTQLHSNLSLHLREHFRDGCAETRDFFECHILRPHFNFSDITSRGHLDTLENFSWQ